MVRYDYDRDDYTDRRRDEIRRDDQLESMIRDLMREVDRPERVMDRIDPQEALQVIVNDPGVKITAPLVKAINDPKVMMDNQGKMVKTSSRVPRGQRGSRNAPLSYPPLPIKRTRKKTKMDKTMSICLKAANAKLRNKNGKLKKGKTMRDVMKMAHRLCKKS